MGEIYLTHCPQKILDTLNIPEEFLRIFEAEEFRIDHAKEVIAEAYISSSQEKFIILVAKIFSKEAQNALLKVLEEPPQRIHFLIIVPYKHGLLPTLCSRMRIIDQTEFSPLQPLDLDVRHLEYSQMYSFLKSLDSLSRIQTQEMIERLLVTLQKNKIPLTQKELDYFDLALSANQHYEKPHILLSLLLLGLIGKRK